MGSALDPEVILLNNGVHVYIKYLLSCSEYHKKYFTESN